MTLNRRPRIVIIGAGFGGLYATKTLAAHAVDVLLIDRNNYHLFTPLLYQVATCALDPSDIAYPVRGIFRRHHNVQFRLGEVSAINHAAQTIQITEESGETHTEAYDFLIIAGGTTNNFFGNQAIQQHSFGMKDLKEAVTLRNHILRSFEKAAWTTDQAERRALTTLVVVGGGPTGLETAGALYELYNYVVRSEYNHVTDMATRVILIEATDRLLAPYPESLRQQALAQLRSLGVEVMLNAKVKTVAHDHVELDSGQTIPTYTLVWAAGIKGGGFGAMLDVKLERGTRIPVKPTLEVEGRSCIFAVGDIAYLLNPHDNQPYPQVIQVAIQQGKLAAQNILSMLANKPLKPFAYRDLGIMATIGRRRAVAYPFNKFKLSGWFAWFTWLGLHLIWLMGFRNRISVFVSWVWNYFAFYLPGAYNSRVILNEKERQPAHDVVQFKDNLT